MQFDIPSIVAAIRDIGVAGLILFALFGGLKGFYVWRWYYDERVADLTKQVNDWKALATNGHPRMKRSKAKVP